MTSSVHPLQAAQARLALSRARLRSALVPAPEAADTPGTSGAGLVPRFKRWWRHWRRQVPSLQVALELARTVLSTPPLKRVGDAVNQQAVPVVRSHPWAAVLLAAAAGAALMTARPWRWKLVTRQWPLLWLPVRQQAMGWLLAQVTGAPGQALLAGVLASLAGRASRSPDPSGVESAAKQVSPADPINRPPAATVTHTAGQVSP